MQPKKRSRINVPPIPTTTQIRSTTSVTDIIASGVAASTSTSSLFRRKPSTNLQQPSHPNPKISSAADLMTMNTMPCRKVGIAGASPNIALRESNTEYYIDLMNDWEIGGTQNRWVCPSDRHLQLRAQLKSGWSVRTSTARSPTNAKLQTGAITEEEQEQIRKVLERAEAGKINEQERIGRMVDRLEKMRTRATGNGVTQCLLCQTEFGLLASKSYAAMCLDCRKYVCQKNCGVDTYDHRRKENVFLCKICSEYREVMWKKSGAWFYREMPEYTKPAGDNGLHSPNMAYTLMKRSPMHPSPTSMSTPTGNGGGMWMHARKSNTPIPPSVFNNNMNGSIPNGRHSSAGPPTSRQLPLPSDQQQRLKCSPRPKITPSWVNEKVQSSMSIDDDDGASSSSSNEGDFKQCGVPLRRHHGNNTHFTRPKDLMPQRQNSGGSTGSARNAPQPTRQKVNLQRFALASRSRITDTDSNVIEFNHQIYIYAMFTNFTNFLMMTIARTSLTAPRHPFPLATPWPPHRHLLVATPSSYGGDDFAQNHSTTVAADASDAKSIDSGVVQSDHSAQQASIAHSFSSHVIPTVPPTFHSAPTPTKLSSSNASSTSTTPNPPPPIPPRNPTPTPITIPNSASTHSVGAGFGAGFHSALGGGHGLPPPLPVASSQQPQPPPAPKPERRFSQCAGTQTTPAKETDTPQPTFMSSPDDEPRQMNVKAMASERSVRPCEKRGKVARIERAERPGNGARLGRRPQPVRRTTTEDDEPDDASNGSLGSIQFSLRYVAEEKKLIVHLIRAKCLKAMDKNGFSDPYVKLHLIPGVAKATKMTSKTVDKTLNPEWNEELVYYGVTEDDKQKKTLRVTVFDRDRIGSDFLGETRFQLKRLPNDEVLQLNRYLEGALPVPADKVEDEERGKILVGISYNVQQGSLFVHIKRCVELIGMDSTGFSDPYCKVLLTPLASKLHKQKTSIKKRTLNPEWNETIKFIVPYKDLPKKTLQINVLDHDVAKQDDYIGSLILSTAAKGERAQQWQKVIENPGQTFEYWHKLELDS
ncbi:hypothetical protein L596_025390 [Steinernema carpocapsae]|uniref:Rabphilin n=1 Tax=Steinernema carpocapsae TaxID=34508 RepID=A0A4U5M7L9_STECR|nr:hypothetical protein L596_025390 [Steinernema carpocapsae]